MPMGIDNKQNSMDVVQSVARISAGLGGSVSAHPTCDLEVVGLIPAGSSNILLWRLIMKYFLLSTSRKAVVSFWRKNVQKCW